MGARQVGRRERPELLESRLEGAAQLQRIEPLIERVLFGARRGRQHRQRAQALVRGVGAIVVTTRARPRAGLAHKLLHRLEEVHVEASERVAARELRIGRLGGEAIIADEVAHDGAVFLLDVGVKVMACRWQYA